jgi:glycosyltransferase involved in cell wall biosynthesis
VQALDVHEGADIVPAAEAADYVRTIDQLLAAPDRASAIGIAGRLRVQQSYSWSAHLQRLDRALARVGAAPVPAASGVPA